MTRPKLTLVLVILGFAVVLLPQLRKSVYRNVTTRPIDSLQTINAAQTLYSQSHPEKGFAPTLAELGREQLIDSVLATGRKSGYVFTFSAEPSDATGRVRHYIVVARPQKNTSGSLSFFIDESGIERFTTEDRNATAKDPPRNDLGGY